MKLTKSLKPALLIATLSVSMSLAHAGQGSTGGGHPIESGFKARLSQIIAQIKKMPPSAQALLTFNFDQLEATVTVGAFKPLCARREKLAQLVSTGKLAFVFPETPHEVTLNCTRRHKKDWKKLLSSNEGSDVVFFIHEGLRVMGLENEDNYQYSASYLTALREAQAEETKVVNDLFLSTTGPCKASVIAAWRYTDRSWDVVLNLGERTIYRREVANIMGDKQRIASELLGKLLTGKYPDIRSDLYHLTTLHCRDEGGYAE